MMELPLNDLSKVKNKELVPKQSTFQNCCPLKLKFLPKKTCEEGTHKCDWWINSAKHNYCFWKLLQDKSSIDGSIKELAQADIARLFGWSSGRTCARLKEAIAELVEALERRGLLGDSENSKENSNFIMSPTKIYYGPFDL